MQPFLLADNNEDKKQKRQEQNPRRSGGAQQRADNRKDAGRPSGIPRTTIEQTRPRANTLQEEQKIKRQRQAAPRETSIDRSQIQMQQWERKNVPSPHREVIRREAREFSDKRAIYKNSAKDRQNREKQQSSYRQWLQSNRSTARDVSAYTRKNYPQYRQWFNSDFYRERGFYPPYWQRDVNWWQGSRWPYIHRWLGWGPTVYPLYYYNGYPLPIQVEIENYYGDNNPSVVGSAEWLPMGVYAVGPDAPEMTSGKIFLQLAINRNGDLAGVYYNSSTNQTYPIEGFVDAKTQLAYWKQIDGQSAPLMSTGLYNLTQDISEVLLTFPSGATLEITLVKIQ